MEWGPGLAASAAPGNSLGIQIHELHPKPAELEPHKGAAQDFMFCQALQVILMVTRGADLKLSRGSAVLLGKQINPFCRVLSRPGLLKM